MAIKHTFPFVQTPAFCVFSLWVPFVGILSHSPVDCIKLAGSAFSSFRIWNPGRLVFGASEFWGIRVLPWTVGTKHESANQHRFSQSAVHPLECMAKMKSDSEIWINVGCRDIMFLQRQSYQYWIYFLHKFLT